MGEDNLKNINYKLPGHDCLLHDSTSSRFAQASPSFSVVRVLVLCPPLQGAEHLPQAVQGPTAQETEKSELFTSEIYLHFSKIEMGERGNDPFLMKRRKTKQFDMLLSKRHQ